MKWIALLSLLVVSGVMAGEAGSVDPTEPEFKPNRGEVEPVQSWLNEPFIRWTDPDTGRVHVDQNPFHAAWEDFEPNIHVLAPDNPEYIAYQERLAERRRVALEQRRIINSQRPPAYYPIIRPVPVTVSPYQWRVIPLPPIPRPVPYPYWYGRCNRWYW